MSVLRKGKIHASLPGTDDIKLACVGKTLIEMPHSSNGTQVLLDITRSTAINTEFDFDANYQNMTLGITDAAWANEMPWFIYLINGTNASAGVQPMISRNPCMAITPAEGYFHYSDAAADTDDELSVVVPYADGTDYSGKPCVLIGACTATYDGTEWTPDLSTAFDGGCTEDALRAAFSTEYTMPTGQNGASASTYLMANGGTAPVFSANTYRYKINRNGECFIMIYLNADGGTDGAGAVQAQLVFPYASAVQNYGQIFGRCSSATGGYHIMTALHAASVGSYALLYELDNSVATVLNGDFTNGGRTLYLNGPYQAFNS